MRKRIAIVGAGMTGLSAAYDLTEVGHEVVVYEAGAQTGGVAGGFKDEGWAWPLEFFYHHLFQTDKSIIGLVEELGLRDKLFFPRPLTSMYYNGEIIPFDSVGAWFKYPPFNVVDVVRFGGVSAFLRFTRFWRTLEKSTADVWMRRWYGERVYEATWRPALINKFGAYYDQVNMAWMWSRLYVRSFKLGYFEGGFATVVQGLTTAVVQRGAEIHLRTPISRIQQGATGWEVTTAQGDTAVFDQVLVTTSPQLFMQLVPSITAVDQTYSRQLQNLKSIGAVVLVAALRYPLMKRTYWLNLPATSPDKTANAIPFLALVEHTNFIDSQHYGGDHILYMGDYVDTDHPYFKMSEQELTELFLSHLSKFNPNFQPSWVRKTWLFRTGYAQPVPFVNQSQNIPALQTPLPGLFFASMSQVYPWDRGTNFAVEIGREVAKQMNKL
jgi:protoporphyrinogen oxidase